MEEIVPHHGPVAYWIPAESLPMSTSKREASFKSAAVERQTVAEDEVDERNEDKDLEGFVLPVVDDGRSSGYLKDTDDIGKGRVLEQGDELPYEGRNHLDERLREYDEAHGLPVRKARRQGGFHLASRD